MKVQDFINKLQLYPLDWDVAISHSPQGPGNDIIVIDLWEEKALAYESYTPIEAVTRESWHQITLYAKEPE